MSRLTKTSTAEGLEDPYDHAISLMDATAPDEEQLSNLSQSESAGWRQLARNATQTSVKDQLARRKYAKWRQDRYDSNGIPVDTNDADTTEQEEGAANKRGRKVEHAEHSDSVAVDFGHSPESPEAKHEGAKKKHRHQHHAKERPREEFAIDILYENQRGSFFCGIPLYSHSSLLQFDPAPWVNKDYNASAVNITNAQVPDPSWQWEWKHWYVDMSGDVDEDGWQYSFAFFGRFAWHGTHPWFHSFCRRRRWLRKRTKVAQHGSGKTQPSSMNVGHHLNTDYFTIHSKRERSPSIADGGPRTARPESYMSYKTNTTVDEKPEEINNISALLKALRLSSVDREKVLAVKQFVDLGGEELAYLKEQIPDIMHFLIFQNSKRQLLEFLKQKAQEAQEHRDEHDAENRPEGEAETRRIDNLLTAVEAADEQIKGLEYWSDRQHILLTAEDPESPSEHQLATIFDRDGEASPTSMSSPASDIRGIGDLSEVMSDPGKEKIYRGAKLAPQGQTTDDQKDKGKGKEKAKDNEDDDDDDDESEASNLDEVAPRLDRDTVIVPEEEDKKSK